MMYIETPLNLIYVDWGGVFVCGCATSLRSGADARTERPYIVDSLCSLRSEFDCGLFRVQYFDVIPDRV